MFDWLENTYRQILDNMTEGVYFVDINQKIQYWNRAAGLLTGIAADEVLFKFFHHRHIQYEDEKGNLLEPFEYPVALCFRRKILSVKTSL
jgi:PAS domain-containing protein